ncbi:MAG: 16S rRNA (cytosine(1402)-N(4))-methyltransferase RsmH, partial [Bacteroidia bacterium]|nr:16S rRNA (cytosine(1402)-N(4))-methyltransferase RsmH [Bacteroidia bacterium]
MAYHDSVLLRESVVGLSVAPSGVYVDLTYGGGGHSSLVLRELGASGRLLCFDKDSDALLRFTDDTRAVGVLSDFRYLRNWLRYYGIAQVDGVLADLGVSSHHFDTPDRGFSYRADGPLDMRMNGQGGRTAADLLNGMEVDALAGLLREYGEVKQAGAIARTVDRMRRDRPLTRVRDLMEAVRLATRRAN